MRLERVFSGASLALSLLIPSGALLASPEDARIVAEVKEAISRAAEIQAGARLKVRSEMGILTISGVSESLYLLDQAQRISASVRGVVDVVVTARVPRGKYTDMQLRDALNRALSPAAASVHELKAQVGYGKVVLTGNAGSYGQKQQVEETVAKIRGVADIVNRIEVTASTNADGSALGRRVHKQILEDLAARPAKLDVKVHDGKALLRGRVPLFLHRLEAEASAFSVPGVSQVENRLIVDPSLTSLTSSSGSD
jgi:osmotically-inducible protein OsmY